MATATPEAVEARIVEALASFGPDIEQVTRDASFEELDIDSLDLVELAQIVEDDYGVELKGDDMKNLKTVGDAIELGGTLVVTRRRVVITGVGAVTPLGVGADVLLRRWVAGEVGIADGEGACRDFVALDHLSKKVIRRADRFAHFAMVASDEALAMGGWADELPYPAERISCVLATGIGGLGSLEAQHDLLRDEGPKAVSPLSVPLFMPNAGAGTLSMRYGLRGQSFSVASACAAGSHAIGVATRMIQYGDADAVLTGGGEATLTPLARASFEAAGALSPTGVSRPFDARRDGFVMGEGAGILLLEDAERAEARGATVLGEVLGYGSTSDAYHLTAPEPEGRHAAEAIRLALADAGRTVADLDYVNAHGTSTPLNDASETTAMKLALGDAARSIPVSSLKSSIGHLLGAAGAVEAIATVMALREGTLPPTVGLEQPDPELDLDYVPLTARSFEPRAEKPLALSNSFGFGGHNVVLCLEGSAGGAAGQERLEADRSQQDAGLEAFAEVTPMSVTTAVETAQERMSPLERLELLCDSGSLEVIRSGVVSPKLGARARVGDGVVGGLGRVDGRPVACYAQDVSFLGGSLGAAHADTISRVLQLAGRSRVPVVGFIESGGARMQEGTAALGGYGRIFRHNVALSGVVPQISIIGGLSAGGGCYSPALTDFVVMTQDAAMFLTGPGVVKDVMGEDVSASELGGHKVHEKNGVCDLVVSDDRAAATLSRSLLSYLPSHAGGGLPRTLAVEPELADPGAAVPDDPRKVYDVRSAIAGIVDGGSLLEIQPRWARSLVTAFARIDGRPVGVIANQPRYMGGVLDAESSQKGARFVETCDAYGIPLVVLVDTPGFMPGTLQEQAGVIRFGATLVRAFSAATVPRVTVVLRKAYGGAYITMNSKDLGADLVFAWEGAQLGVMGAVPAVGIIHRRELAAAADPVAERTVLADAYAEEHLGADVAAAAGFVDEVIAPRETRRRLSWALGTLDDRRSGAVLA